MLFNEKAAPPLRIDARCSIIGKENSFIQCLLVRYPPNLGAEVVLKASTYKLACHAYLHPPYD